MISEHESPARICILGVAIDNIDETGALERISAYVTSGQPHHVVTVNPEFVMEARRNPVFRRVLAAADLATPDGVGLVLVARWRGMPLRGRVTGVALTEQIAALAAREGWSLFLLGAQPGIAERAAAVLQERNPGLRIAGCYAGSPRPADEDARRHGFAEKDVAPGDAEHGDQERDGERARHADVRDQPEMQQVRRTGTHETQHCHGEPLRGRRRNRLERR